MGKSKENSLLIENTTYLYALTVSTQVLNVIYIPYITRVFGPKNYGMISLALSIMSYFQLILDMGFTLSATSSVAENEGNSQYISKLFSLVTFYKAIVGAILLLFLLIICNYVYALRPAKMLIFLYGIAFLINSFLPDFIYRGLQKMKNITVRTVFIKVIFTVLVFAFIKKPDDYLSLPMILMVGNALAVLISWLDLGINSKVFFTGFSLLDLKMEIHKSFPFFLSRIASTFYQAMNTLIIGVLYPGQVEVGYYGTADKVSTLVKTASSPIADSIYPYMIKRKNYVLVRKLVIIYFIGVCLLIYPIIRYTCEIAAFVFGEEYYMVGYMIRYLLPGMIVIFPSYLICFPVLVPLGCANEANASNILGAIVQILLLIALWKGPGLNVYRLCAAASTSEVMVFIFRLMSWIKADIKLSNRKT